MVCYTYFMALTREILIVKILRSNYCKVVWLLGFFGSYFLIPKHLFMTAYAYLALFFMLGFATMLTCFIHNVKEKITLAKTYKSSFLGILASVLGLTALQLCGLGSAFCSGSIFLGLLTTIFPGVALGVFSQYAVELVIFSIIMQAVTIWQMGCFKK